MYTPPPPPPPPSSRNQSSKELMYKIICTNWEGKEGKRNLENEETIGEKIIAIQYPENVTDDNF